MNTKEITLERAKFIILKRQAAAEEIEEADELAAVREFESDSL